MDAPTAREEVVVTVDDIERLGCSNMNGSAKSYCNAGADLEQTLKENRMAYLRLRLLPRILRDVSRRRLEATLLGDQKVSMPVGVSPSALHKLWHPDGEIATARTAQAEQALMVLSTYSSTSMEVVKREVPDGLFWFQVQFAVDRDLTRSLVRRAERSGYRALVVTVDSPVLGKKIDAVMRRFYMHDGIRFGNLEASPENKSANAKAMVSVRDAHVDPSQSWDDITWLKSITSLPLVLEGITNTEDAEEAISRGASAIFVSNHGGRQLDGLPATIEVLPEVVSAVRGRVEVYLDGGVRHGTDVIKALALGAKAAFVGRPTIWGLAYNGEAGVRQMLAILRREVDRDLALMALAERKLASTRPIRSCFTSQIRQKTEAFGYEVLDARRLGKSHSAVIVFARNKVLFAVSFNWLETPCFIYKKPKAACLNCGQKLYSATKREFESQGASSCYLTVIPVKTGDQRVHVVNIYGNPKDHKTDIRRVVSTAVEEAGRDPVVIAGEAPHPAWGYRFVTPRRLAELINRERLTLLTDSDQPPRTGSSTTRDTCPDLTIVKNTESGGSKGVHIENTEEWAKTISDSIKPFSTEVERTDKNPDVDKHLLHLC
ncbi:hydroxyacid oxidase 1-like [Ixodes scapularis]|uniref:hydroxyacid oxidase 1-like n=1 Tax=Ixodes scapularis TaxID=6945 RepID=UPI001C3851D8|nr:hydroxyacid oxidase 1-like [Ixodes scapularis]